METTKNLSPLFAPSPPLLYPSPFAPSPPGKRRFMSRSNSTASIKFSLRTPTPTNSTPTHTAHRIATFTQASFKDMTIAELKQSFSLLREYSLSNLTFDANGFHPPKTLKEKFQDIIRRTPTPSPTINQNKTALLTMLERVHEDRELLELVQTEAISKELHIHYSKEELEKILSPPRPILTRGIRTIEISTIPRMVEELDLTQLQESFAFAENYKLTDLEFTKTGFKKRAEEITAKNCATTTANHLPNTLNELCPNDIALKSMIQRICEYMELDQLKESFALAEKYSLNDLHLTTTGFKKRSEEIAEKNRSIIIPDHKANSYNDLSAVNDIAIYWMLQSVYKHEELRETFIATYTYLVDRKNKELPTFLKLEIVEDLGCLKNALINKDYNIYIKMENEVCLGYGLNQRKEMVYILSKTEEDFLKTRKSIENPPSE
jgi:hypothetical protein